MILLATLSFMRRVIWCVPSNENDEKEWKGIEFSQPNTHLLQFRTQNTFCSAIKAKSQFRWNDMVQHLWEPLKSQRGIVVSLSEHTASKKYIIYVILHYVRASEALALQVTGGNNFQLIASNPKELCKICVRLLSKDVVRDSVRGSMTVNHLERTRWGKNIFFWLISMRCKWNIKV